MSHQHSRHFGFFYHLTLIWKAAFAMHENGYLKRYRAMNLKWKERIMLAVTQVNQCAMCSWMHTHIALNAGMHASEIKTILQGDYTTVPEPEITSVLYAQDVAAHHEKINPEFKTKLITQYGQTKARAIDNVIAVITMTNSMGIHLGRLKATLTLKHEKNSSLFREIFIPLSTMILFPIFYLLAWIFTPIYVRLPAYRNTYL